jgi:hypothetical protein
MRLLLALLVLLASLSLMPAAGRAVPSVDVALLSMALAPEDVGPDFRLADERSGLVVQQGVIRYRAEFDVDAERVLSNLGPVLVTSGLVTTDAAIEAAELDELTAAFAPQITGDESNVVDGPAIGSRTRWFHRRANASGVRLTWDAVSFAVGGVGVFISTAGLRSRTGQEDTAALARLVAHRLGWQEPEGWAAPAGGE